MPEPGARSPSQPPTAARSLASNCHSTSTRSSARSVWLILCRSSPRVQYIASRSRLPGLEPFFEQNRLAVERFLAFLRAQPAEGAVRSELPGVGGVGELELEES